MKRGWLLIGVVLLFVSLVYGAIFQDTTQANFNNGTYINTTWNGSAVVLVGGNTSGTFTSRVFNATADATWNNLSSVTQTPNLISLFAVDGSGAVWRSTNSGVNWTQRNASYGGGAATSDMFNDGTYLYIVFGSSGGDVYRSEDNGVSWSIVKDALASNIQIGSADSTGSLYIVAGDGTVYKSINFGINWTSVGDFNGGASNNPKGIDVDSSDNIYVVDSSGAVWRSTNSGADWTKQNSSYGGTSGTDDLAVDSSDNLYILFNVAVYQSTNQGVDWSIIKSDYGGNQDGLTMIIDQDDNFFIVDPSGDVYSTTDPSGTWSLVGDFNGGATNDIKGLTSVFSESNVSFQVRACSQSDCSDGTFANADLSNLNLTSQYFQYQVNFSSPGSGAAPQLQSVSVDYDLNNQAPIISLVSPTNKLYTINESLDLNFSVSDGDDNLDSCWYSLNSGLNNVSLINCQNTTFDVADGSSYNLSVYANDSFGLITNGNVSFDVDSQGVSVTIYEPTGTKSSRTVSYNFNVTAADGVSCVYNVYRGSSEEVANTSVDCSNESVTGSFSVTVDADFVFRVYANNSFGSKDNKSSSFTIDTSTGGSPPSGGGGGGSTTIIQNVNITEYDLEIGSINDLNADSGETKKLTLNAKNKGLRLLNGCNVISYGDYDSWISSSVVKNLASGEESGFGFDLNVPADISAGKYLMKLSIACQEDTESTVFNVNILEKKIGFDIIDVSRVNENQISVRYSLQELSGFNQDVDLQFLLFAPNNEKVAEFNEVKSLQADSNSEFETFILVEPSISGELSLLVNLNSETYSTFVQEDVVIGRSTGGGFAVLENFGDNDTFFSGVLILLFLAFAFFMTRRIIGHRKIIDYFNFGKK